MNTSPTNSPISLPELFSLRGRTALVTGGCGHLGKSMCQVLAEAGAAVVVTSRNQEKAQALADGLPRVGEVAHRGIALDHMQHDTLDKSFREALEHTGAIDILINNGHEALAVDWTNVTADQFSRHLENATGYFMLARLVRDQAVERSRSASIVMLGSMYGVVGSYPEAYTGVAIASPVAYHALKGGIVHMTRHLAVYWACDNVRVNCLSPGPFPSPAASPEMVERLCVKSPMKRMGKPDELKGAVLFLASDASSYVTGQNLIVDGGWTAW